LLFTTRAAPRVASTRFIAAAASSRRLEIYSHDVEHRRI